MDTSHYSTESDFAWEKLPEPIIALSPMADMTDSPFCLVAKELGAPIVFREMVSSEALVRGNEKTMWMADFDAKERPIIQQIFGSDPDVMGEAARIIEQKYHPDGVDINMGCPVYKITHNFNGASLMRDKDRACAIVRKMKENISVPLSVKIRLGWEDPTEALEFVKYLEDAGAELITVHGRTKKQAYSGKSDWEMIGQVVRQVSIPVLANGDIHKPEQVPEALRVTGAQGVLIARGALGNPWFFRHAQEVLETGTVQTPIDMEERMRVMLHHAQMHVEHYGEKGVKTFRKHGSWYLKNLPHVKEFRQKVVRVESLEELNRIAKEFLDSREVVTV